MQEHDIINMTYKFAEEYHASDNSGHDFEHIKRVYANVNKLLESEKNANNFIAKMSALLHDVDDHKLNTDGKNTERFLRKIGLENKIIDQILETIGAISFSQSGCNPNFKTLEMKLLSDADKLDAWGLSEFAGLFVLEIRGSNLCLIVMNFPVLKIIKNML